jgi:hypothetical protein
VAHQDYERAARMQKHVATLMAGLQRAETVWFKQLAGR